MEDCRLLQNHKSCRHYGSGSSSSIYWLGIGSILRHALIAKYNCSIFTLLPQKKAYRWLPMVTSTTLKTLIFTSNYYENELYMRTS
jgi:hypothetical protein